MRYFLIITFLLVAACSQDPAPQQELLKKENSQIGTEGFNDPALNLIPTEDGIIDLNKRTKIEYRGEFKNERPLDTKLTISHEQIDFGLVNGSQMVGYRVSVKNIGVDEALNLKLTTSDNFLIGSDRCSGLNLKTDEVCTFRILFKGKGKTNGEYTGLATVYAEANSQVSTNLKAQVGEAKNLRLESLQGTEIAFTARGNQEVIRNIRIVNRGPGVAEQLQVKTYSGEFRIVSNGCEGASLALNQYCTIVLSYNPEKHHSAIIKSKMTIIPPDYINNSLEINLITTPDTLVAVQEPETLDQDKNKKPEPKQKNVTNPPVSLKAPNLDYNLKKINQLDKLANKKSEAIDNRIKSVEKVLQEELLNQQQAEAQAQADQRKKAELAAKQKAEELAKKQAAELEAKIAAEKKRAQEEAARLKQESLAKQQAEEKLKKEQLAKAKAEQERLAREEKQKAEAAAKAQAEELARQKAEQAKQAAEQREQKRLALEQARQEKLRQEQAAAEKRKQDQLKAEQERLAQLAAQKQAEQEQLRQAQELKNKQAREKAEQERLAQEQAEKIRQQKALVEQERLAKIKAEEEKQAQEKAQKAAELLAKQKAEAEAKQLAEQQAQLARQKAEQEQQAREQAQREKQLAEQKQAAALVLQQSQAKQKAAADLLAKQQAAKSQSDKMAAIKAEEDRLAKEKQDQEKKVQEQAVKAQQEQAAALQKKQAQEKAEQERLAQIEAQRQEDQRIAQEKAEQERLVQEQARQEQLAKEQAFQEEQARLEQEAAQARAQEAARIEEEHQAQIAAQKQAQEQAAAQAEQERVEAENLAKKQAEEQQAWVVYQQQQAKIQESHVAVSPNGGTSIKFKTYQVAETTPAKNAAVTKVVNSEKTSTEMTAQAAQVETINVGDNEGGTGGVGSGSGPLTAIEIQPQSPIEVGWFKGLVPYNLYQRIVPTQVDYMPIQVNPLLLQEGRVVNQKALLNISTQQPLANVDATDLEREIKLEIKATGMMDRCSFTGVFSYLSCLAGTVSLYVKDLINFDKGTDLKVESQGLVSNEVPVSRYMLSQVSQYLIPAASTLPNQAIYRGEFYFQAKLLENQSKLFKISGYNIFQVSNLNPGQDDSPWKLVVHNGELYFAALDSQGHSKLFKTNGNKIVQLSNIFPEGNDYLTPAIVYNGELYLEGMNGDGFLKLFKTDGKNIIQISDTNPTGSDAPSDFSIYKGELYFRAQNMAGLTKLFKLNQSGIFQVSNINQGQHDAPEFLQTYHDYLYFSAFVENLGNKLFRTDGNTVEQVLSINPGNDEPSDLLVYQDNLYFVAVNKQGYRKLFKMNEQEAQQVSNIKEGSDFALDYRNKKSFLTIYNDELYFVAKNQNNGFKLFKTDGVNVVQVSNINAVSPELNPTGSDFPFNLIVYNGDLYFSAYSNTAGLKLFKLNSELNKGITK